MNLQNQIDLVGLRRRVELELAEYVYVVPDGTIGNPMAEDRVGEYLLRMKAALISPYLVQVEIRETYAQIGTSEPELRTCAIVAKDDTQSPMLAYDSVANEFVLVERTGNGAIQSIGVRGDAVGCFMAR